MLCVPHEQVEDRTSGGGSDYGCDYVLHAMYVYMCMYMCVPLR